MPCPNLGAVSDHVAAVAAGTEIVSINKRIAGPR